MHRIDTPTAQKDKFGAGKNGFTRGNPQTGTPATDLDDDYFDMLQEELAGIVEAAATTLDKSKRNQVLTALKALFLARTSIGVGAGQIPDMSSFQLTGMGSDNLLAKFPNGLILQVFRRSLANSTTIGVPTTVPVTYPTPFPTNIWGAFCTKMTYAQINTSCESATKTGFNAVTCLTSGTSPGSNLSDAVFLAIGY
ncbi:hypothetical protein AAHD62_04845 [Enterobacter hormaechei]